MDGSEIDMFGKFTSIKTTAVDTYNDIMDGLTEKAVEHPAAFQLVLGVAVTALLGGLSVAAVGIAAGLTGRSVQKLKDQNSSSGTSGGNVGSGGGASSSGTGGQAKSGVMFGQNGKKDGRSKFPENPNDLFPENYAGLTKEVKPDGKINYIVQAGGKTYKVEYHPKHQDGNHYDGNHYHVLKLAETPKPGKTKPPYFRLPNLDPDTPAQGGTFAPGDLLPTKNKK